MIILAGRGSRWFRYSHHVIRTGDNRDIGQVVIGQIHAGKDEPARLYYQKFAGSKRGSIYVAHEPSGDPDGYVQATFSELENIHAGYDF
jgi:hypothetical protein